MSGWFNMETAPKDGRDILIGWWRGQRWIVVSAHYTIDRTGHDNRASDRGSWYVTKGGGGAIWVDSFYSDYRWMPLPPPPPREGKA